VLIATKKDAMDFVEHHGAVTESARGPIPSLAEAIAGERIYGSWWGHPKGHLMYQMFNDVRDSPDVLTCRLMDGKVTFVHRNLWPALVQMAPRFDAARLGAIHEEHTTTGAHRAITVKFPDWVPQEVRAKARLLSEKDAAIQLRRLLPVKKSIELGNS
jgi:hypothetical protein